MIIEHFSLIGRKIQYINLYGALPEERIVKFSFARCMLIVMSVVILVSMISAYNMWQQWTLNKEMMLLSKASNQAAKNLQSLKSRFGQEGKKVEKLKSELSKKQGAAQALSGAMQEEREQYSRYFDIFANDILPGVWLTYINIQGQNHSILLKGKAVSLQDTLDFVRSLNNQKIFGKAPFKLTEIIRPNKEDETEQYTFQLTTRGQ